MGKSLLLQKFNCFVNKVADVMPANGSLMPESGGVVPQERGGVMPQERGGVVPESGGLMCCVPCCRGTNKVNPSHLQSQENYR